ncbi:MAG: hypothetical protein R2834_18870 [Rhodothermales bacterium]
MSSTLAIVLTVALGILLVVGLGALVLYKRFERTAALRAPRPVQPSVSPQQELSALGIIEIRPKARRGSDSPAPDPSGSPASASEDATLDVADLLEETSPLDPLPEPDEAIEVPREEASEEASEVVETEPRGARRQDPAPAPPRSDKAAASPEARVGGRPDLIPMLQAIRSSAGGYTVCLVRHDEDFRYELVAIVSESPQALAAGSILIHPGVLDEALQMAPVSIKDIGSDEVTWEGLGYYRMPVSVRQAAIVPVRVPDDENAYLLIIDALAWRDLDDPWQRLLLGQFATLIGTYMASPLPGDAAQKDKLRIRPRREIIAEEMERARENGRSLSLALIYLNRAEAIADQGVKALGAAERALKKNLQQAAQTGRLERFGELTYGVFHDEDVTEVEAWALRLQEDLAADTEHLAGGVSIGIALLKDRHATPDDFRADATEALREAFETGACTIIE